MKTSIISGQKDILESILHGILITDLRGHITYWNEASEEILGFSKSEIIGKPVSLLYDDQEAMPFKKILQKCQHEKCIHGRWHARCKKGIRIWLDVRAKIVEDEQEKAESCVISFSNIEKLEATERDLERSKQLAEAILETSADAIITTDESGLILSINKAAEKMFGYQKSEILQKNATLLMPHPYRETFRMYAKQSGENEINNFHGTRRELFGLKKNGTVFPVYLSLSEVSWYGNRIFAGVIRDLSHKRELEKKIAEVGNEERRNIGRELHDGLGQMLTGIRMVTENLAAKLLKEENPYAGEIQEVAEMVRETDEYARTLSRGLAQIDLDKQGLSVALQNLLKRVEKTTGIQCSFSEIGTTDHMNHSKALHIYRIVQEAVNNVIRHAKAKKISVRLVSDDQHVLLVIDDDGKGFRSSSDLMKGSGIQIMKYRAELLGGILDVSRRINRTTRVRCIIPHGPEHFNKR